MTYFISLPQVLSRIGQEDINADGGPGLDDIVSAATIMKKLIEDKTSLVSGGLTLGTMSLQDA